MAIALLLLLLLYYSAIRHGDIPHNYVSNDIFGFAVSPGLTTILPIDVYHVLRHPVYCIASYCCNQGCIINIDPFPGI